MSGFLEKCQRLIDGCPEFLVVFQEIRRRESGSQTGVQLAGCIVKIDSADTVFRRGEATVVVDDACEPKQGPVAANRVVNDKIHYVVGPVCSGASIAAAPIYNNEGAVVVTPSATSPALILPMLWLRTGERPAAGAWAGAALVVVGMGLLFIR